MKRAALSLLTIFLLIFAGSLSAERVYFDNSAKSSDFGVDAISIFSTQIDFTIPYCDIESKEGYSVIKMDEYGSFAETEGFPALPVVVKTIAIPDQGDLEFEIVGYKETELKGTYKIYPMQPPMPEVVGFKPTFVKDDDAYSVNAVYPASNVVISDPAIIRDVRFSKVYIYPYRYNPVTGKVYVMTEGTIVLKVNASKSTGESPVSNVLTEEFNASIKACLTTMTLSQDTRASKQLLTEA